MDGYFYFCISVGVSSCGTVTNCPESTLMTDCDRPTIETAVETVFFITTDFPLPAVTHHVAASIFDIFCLGAMHPGQQMPVMHWIKLVTFSCRKTYPGFVKYVFGRNYKISAAHIILFIVWEHLERSLFHGRRKCGLYRGLSLSGHSLERPPSLMWPKSLLLLLSMYLLLTGTKATSLMWRRFLGHLMGECTSGR